MKRKLNQMFLVAGIIAIISVISLTSFSYGQTHSIQPSDLSKDSKTFIFVQTYLRNSNGQLIVYLGSDQFTDINVVGLEKLLSTEETENDPIIDIKGKKYQVIKRGLTIPQEKENVIASTLLASIFSDKIIIIARFAHDGYPIIEGDIVTTIWTFIRPVQ